MEIVSKSQKIAMEKLCKMKASEALKMLNSKQGENGD